MSFTHLDLADFLLKRLPELGYTTPTPIQQQAIPVVLAGDDLLASAATGSGKTAGFALPLLKKLAITPATAANQVQHLVLVPTRELATQVEQAFRAYGEYFPRRLTTLAIYGGVSISAQMQAACRGCDVVIATPGRLIDLLGKNALQLDQVSTLVLDEADRMLELGFADELEEILQQLPSKRQNLLFSATFPKNVDDLAADFLHNPKQISVTETLSIPDTLQQRAIEVDRDRRTALLKHLLKEQSYSQVLVFVGSKRSANNIELKLYRSGIQASVMHGDLSQFERQQALADFKSGRCKILIATDLAARGIDIPNLPCVINYELPRAAADYIHRIGRTARAGESGVAISFVDHESDSHFRLICKRYKLQIEREQIAGLERATEVPESVKQTKGKAPVKGKRKSKKDKLREAAALKGQEAANK